MPPYPSIRTRILAKKKSLPGGGFEKTKHQTYCRCLPGTVGSKVAEHFTFSDAERDIIQRRYFVELLADMSDVYHDCTPKMIHKNGAQYTRLL